MCALQRGKGSTTEWIPSVSWLFFLQWQCKFFSYFQGLFLVLLFCTYRSAEDGLARKSRLFYMSTSQTTLRTQSSCHVLVSHTSLTNDCNGRKRRAINMDGGLSLNDASSVELEPSQQDSSAPRYLLLLAQGRGGSWSTGPSPSPPPKKLGPGWSLDL